MPPLLLVMFLLCALHGYYLDIVEQFWTWHKSLETTLSEMIVADVTSKPPSQIPAASVAHTENPGTVWSSPFNWLCKGYGC